MLIKIKGIHVQVQVLWKEEVVVIHFLLNKYILSKNDHLYYQTECYK